jgi:hypothetical protein
MGTELAPYNGPSILGFILFPDDGSKASFRNIVFLTKNSDEGKCKKICASLKTHIRYKMCCSRNYLYRIIIIQFISIIRVFTNSKKPMTGKQ